jgi:hypothetical protein
MYEFSRAIYRELADEILEDPQGTRRTPITNACCVRAKAP